MLKSVLVLCLALTVHSVSAAQLTDPTRPRPFGVSAPDDTDRNAPLRLTLIRLGPRPLAIIDGTVLKPGDRIGSYRLLALQPGRAVLTGESGQLTLPLVASLHQASTSRTSGTR